MNSKAYAEAVQPEIRSHSNGLHITWQWIREYVDLLAVLVIQLALTSTYLYVDSMELWLDEAYTALVTSLPIQLIHEAMIFDAGPPLYYDMVHVWRILFGSSEFALRSLSILFSLVVTVYLYLFCRRFFSVSAFWFAAAVWVVSPLSVHYAVEARNYTMFAALTVSYVYYLFCFVKIKKREFLDTATFLGIAMVYTHHVGWFVVLASVISTIGGLKELRHRVYVLISFLVIIVSYVPWIPFLILQMQNTHMSIAWTGGLWSPWLPLHTLYAFIPGGSTPGYMKLTSEPIVFWCCTGIFLLISAYGIYSVYTSPVRKWVLLTLLTLGLALLGPYLYSYLSSNIYLPGRTDVAVYPLFCLLLACPASRFFKPLYWAVILATLTLSGYMLYQNLDQPLSRSEYSIIRFLENNGQAGDVVLTTGLTRPVLQYYLDDQFEFMSYPAEMAQHLAHINEEWLMQNIDLEQEAEILLNSIAEGLRDRNLWIISSDRPINRILEEKITQNPQLSMYPIIRSNFMGLRVLNEPVYIIRLRRIDATGEPDEP
jgi:uncharacterized membrane protein